MLTEAALKGKMDYLRGLKKRHRRPPYPRRTGYREYVDQDITVGSKERPDRFLDELQRQPDHRRLD